MSGFYMYQCGRLAIWPVLTAVFALGLLSGCSGSGDEGASGPTVVPNLVQNEARRSAAIYSSWQQVMSVLLVTLRSPDHL